MQRHKVALPSIYSTIHATDVCGCQHTIYTWHTFFGTGELIISGVAREKSIAGVRGCNLRVRITHARSGREIRTVLQHVATRCAELALQQYCCCRRQRGTTCTAAGHVYTVNSNALSFAAAAAYNTEVLPNYVRYGPHGIYIC